MIELKDVNFKYKNGDMVLKDINLKIHEKEFVTIIGKNGSGKSTLLKLIGGITKATKGEAIVDDIDLNNKKNFMSIWNKKFMIRQFRRKNKRSLKNSKHGRTRKCRKLRLINGAKTKNNYCKCIKYGNKIHSNG